MKLQRQFRADPFGRWYNMLSVGSGEVDCGQGFGKKLVT